MRQSRQSNKSSTSIKNFSQTNFSVSKQMYGFPKSPRFPDSKQICPKHTYGGDKIKTKKSGASIGSGFKLDFTKDLTCSPGSSRYMIKSHLEEGKQKSKGFSIALGRQKCTYRQYVSKQLCRTPSMNKYQLNLSIKNNVPNYSIRSRTKMINKTMTIQPQNDNPGPSDYNNPQISTETMKNVSKFSTISYSATKSNRFSTQRTNVPGPGSYRQYSNLSSVGKYIISAHKGGTNAKFDNVKRVTHFEQLQRKSKAVPGVGSYKMPSQFGQYD